MVNRNPILCRPAMVLVCLLCTTFCWSQEEFRKPQQGTLTTFFFFGNNNVNLTSLNASLANKAYPTVQRNLFDFGLGVHAVIQRFLVGAEGGFLWGSTRTSESSTSKFSASSFFIDSGYLIFSKRSLRVYTFLGIGYGGMQLKLHEDFDPSEDDPWIPGGQHPADNDRELGTSGSLLKLALGTDYQLVFDEHRGIMGALIVGLRVGYNLALTGWKLDGLDSQRKPDVGITGPYVHLMLGFGGFAKKQ